MEMNKKREKVIVCRKLPGNAVDRLKEFADIVMWKEDTPVLRDFLVSNIKDAYGIISLLSDRIDKEIIDKAERLKIISNYAVGIDNIDVHYAKKRGIIVTNTPDVLTEATAELAWALLFAVARRLKEGIKIIENNLYRGWSPSLLTGYGISGKVLGIVGAGRIGTKFGLMSKGFNMKVLYYSRSKNDLLERELRAEKVSLEDIFEKADYVSIHLPLTKETKNIIHRKLLFTRKDGAFIINTGRGEVIEEKALIEALKEGYIKGAGLDVFNNEPDPDEELISLPQVVVLPHIGSATYETREKMAYMAVDAIIKLLKGEIPENIVRI